MSDHKWDRFKRVFGGTPSDKLIEVRNGKVRTALGQVDAQIKRVTDAGLDPGALKQRRDAVEKARSDAMDLKSNKEKSDTLDTVKADARGLAGEAPGLADAILREDADLGVRAGQDDQNTRAALTQIASDIKRVTDAGLPPGNMQQKHDALEQRRADAMKLAPNRAKADAMGPVLADAGRIAGELKAQADGILQAEQDDIRLAGERDSQAKASLGQIAGQIKRITDAKGDPGTLQQRHDAIEQARVDALKLTTNKEKAAALEKVTQDAGQLVKDAVGLADGLLRPPLEKRQQELVTALGTIPDRIAALTKVPPPGVTKALKDCTDARARADAACKASPLDEKAADAALKAFETMTTALGTACLKGAGVLAKDFADRFNAKDAGKPAGKAILKAYADLADARKLFDEKIKGKDGLAALEAAGAVEKALASFETAASPSTKDKAKTAKKAFEDLAKLTDDKLDKLSLQDKAELALELCANGTPDDDEPDPANSKNRRPKAGGSLDQLCRLYKHSAPDPKFMDKRAKQRDQIGDELVKMDEIKKLYKKDGTLDEDYWKDFTKDANNVLKLLQNVCDVQADAMGMKRIPVSMDPDPPQQNGTMGGYNPASNSITLNLHPAYLKPVSEAFDTIIHETFHAHQDTIVKRLKAGEIKPGDDEYATAVMYMVNDIPVGYVFEGNVGNDNYKTQPTEFDSFHHAAKTIENVMGKAKANATKGG